MQRYSKCSLWLLIKKKKKMKARRLFSKHNFRFLHAFLKHSEIKIQFRPIKKEKKNRARKKRGFKNNKNKKGIDFALQVHKAVESLCNRRASVSALDIGFRSCLGLFTKHHFMLFSPHFPIDTSACIIFYRILSFWFSDFFPPCFLY